MGFGTDVAGGFLRRRARPRRRRSRRETQSPGSSNRRRRRRRRRRRPRRRRGILPSDRRSARPPPSASPSRTSSLESPCSFVAPAPREVRAAPARSSPPRDGPRRSKPRAEGPRTPHPSSAARHVRRSPRPGGLFFPQQSVIGWRCVSSAPRSVYFDFIARGGRRRSLACRLPSHLSQPLSPSLMLSLPRTRHARLPPPPRPPYSLPRNLPHRVELFGEHARQLGVFLAMTTFSWLPSTACLVQLKLPLMR